MPQHHYMSTTFVPHPEAGAILDCTAARVGIRFGDQFQVVADDPDVLRWFAEQVGQAADDLETARLCAGVAGELTA